MSQLEKEIDANARRFLADWTAVHAANVASLQANDAFRASYRRISVLQAIKSNIITPIYTSGSAEFFHEAHNDALVSHVAASSGAWRSALQALRSCVENALCAIYYNEHPVELELWRRGEFIITCGELIKYLEKHPIISSSSRNVTGINVIRAEYATLSKAVHGSATSFRMTDSASSVLLWSDDPVKASSWSTRERKTLEGLCLLIASLHHNALQGTKMTPVRDMLGFAVSASGRKALKTTYGINS